MLHRASIYLTMSVILLGVAVPLWAEGKGGGLNRALSAAGKGKSNAGLSRAADQMSRSAKGLDKSGSSFGRSHQGLQRASSSLNRSVDGADLDRSQVSNPSSTNPQRIADRRMEQADHLREVAEKNGNERLNTTADRMSESAARNYQRRTGVPYQPPTSGTPTDPTTSTPTDSTTTTTTTTTTPPPPTPSVQPASGIAPTSTAPRSGWRSWFSPR